MAGDDNDDHIILDKLKYKDQPTKMKKSKSHISPFANRESPKNQQKEEQAKHSSSRNPDSGQKVKDKGGCIVF